MIVQMLPLWIAAANVMGCIVVQMGIAWGITQLDADRFRPGAWLYRQRKRETGGRIYERIFLIRKWKPLLPDGAAWFKNGFPKKNLRGRNPEYLRRFEQETCRGELAHWLQLACAPLFFLWNPPWAGGIVTGYLMFANIPCILVQRYNRARIESGRTRKY